MGMDAGNKPGSVKSDINITPLVDVVLVLLIIFMVVTPMLQKGQAVMVPVAGNPEKKPDDTSQIMVVIGGQKSALGGNASWQAGKVWIDKDEVQLNNFPEAIKTAFDRNPNGNVMVKADSRLQYGDVKDIILKVRDAGFKNVGLIANKKDQAG